jgi:hypothetical protein
MAYITNHTYKKLCQTLDIKEEINLNLFLEHIYNNPKVFYFFNKVDLKYLFNTKNILQNEVNYKIEHFQFVPAKEDSKTYVFERSGKLKYHLDPNCSLLKKDYQNYTIPQELKELGDSTVEVYRNWFVENNFKERYENGELDKTAIIFRYNAKFPQLFNVPVLNENYELIKNIDNSGHINQGEQFDFQEFLKTLDKCIKLKEAKLQCEVHRKLAKFDYLVNRSDAEIKEKMTQLFSSEFTGNYGIEKIRTFLKEYRVIKFEVMQNLINYFKWSYKSNNHEFDNATLEDFGLKCCGSCQRNNK